MAGQEEYNNVEIVVDDGGISHVVEKDPKKPTSLLKKIVKKVGALLTPTNSLKETNHN